MTRHILADPALTQFAPDAPTADRPLREGPGARIGRYKLLQPIGEGGFGMVFMAEQEDPVRRLVALKIIKLGMDTRQVIARFEAERQALAMMDHPNIARVLDAGATDSGRPFFVMELVRGVPITEYCDAARLSTRQRLELFIHVCRAVQHAHQKGIIHRDIKPSNVLVTLHDGVPVPKVIDFGIAKATQARLTDKTLFTEFRQLIGTPEYMAPEQAEMSGLDMDTRSDLYSLGVLLYQLLTGATPFESQRLRTVGHDGLQRILRDEEPPRPSTRLSGMAAAHLATIASQRRTDPRRLRQQLRGELDWIIMKCLEKDRGRRYETANSLVADVERYLANEPVTARPTRTAYRLRKFVSRHKAGTAAALAIVASLVLGIIGTTIGLLDARTARDEAVDLRERESVLRADAQRARQDAIEKLRESYLAQARGGRWSGQMGRRFESLRALADAAAIRPGPQLIDEAVACMALVDLREARTFSIPDGTLAFDPSMARYARSHPDGTIRIRWRRDDAEIAVLRGPEAARGAILRFDPNGRLLAALHPDDPPRLVLWDIDRRQVARLLTVPRRVLDIDFSPDGATLASLSDNAAILLHAVATGEARTVPVSIAGARTLRFSPDGATLAVAFDNRVALVDLAQGRSTRTLSHTALVYAIAWHPGGQIIASACGDFRLHLTSVETGQVRAVMSGHLSDVIAVRFNPAGNLVATIAWDGTARLWDPVSGQQLVSAPAPDANIIQFSEDSRWLVLGNSARVSLLELAPPGEYRLLYGHSGDKGPRGLAFSPDGALLATVGIDGLYLWDVATGRILAQAAVQRIGSVVFAPDGKSLITSGGGPLYRWPIRRLDNPPALQVGPPRAIGQGYGRCTLSADGRLLAVHAEPHYVHVFPTDDPSKVVRSGYHHDVNHIALSPDGAILATGTRHGKDVKIWDARNGKLIQDLPGAIGMAEVAFSPDGRWLVTGAPDHYAFWSVATWTLHHRVERSPLASLPGYIAFSPDGRIAALAHSNFVATLVEAATGRALATLQPPDSYYLSWMAFSRDGTRFAASTENHVVQLWDLGLIHRNLAGMGLDAALPAAADAEPPPREPLAVKVRLWNALPYSMLRQRAKAAGERAVANPGDIEALRDAANLACRVGDLKDAGERLRRLAELQPADHWPLYILACLQLYLDDRAGYEKSCRQLMDRFSGHPAPEVSDRTAKTWLLVPRAGEDLDRCLKLTERAVSQPAVPGLKRWFPLARAIAEYRAGRFDQAVPWLDLARHDELPPSIHATADCFLAMIHHRQNRPDAARAALRAATDCIRLDLPIAGQDDLDQGGFENWLIAHIIHREATAVLAAPP